MANIETTTKKYNINVKLSSDYYHAFISIDAEDYDFLLSKEEIINALKENKVVFGLDYNVIEKISKDPSNVEMIEIATGIKHIHGEDAEIIYNVDMESKFKPSENPDGTIDFKKTNFSHEIKINQVLATKTQATEGIDGTSVTGIIIKAKNGKEKNFSFGKNVILSDDNLILLSGINGTLKVEGYKISIIEILEVFSDVGIKTGNISFVGKIIIRGDVTSGFKVESQNSIEVFGIVESAELIAGVDIIINGGVQGNDECLIQAKGDITGSYFNNCKIISGGQILTNSMLHCDVTCDKSIFVQGKKGLIMGGSYITRHHITAKVIGAEIGTITKLQMGITNEIMTEFQDLAVEIKELKSNKDKLLKASVILKKQKAVKPDDKKIEEMFTVTQKSLKEYIENLKDAMKKFADINELINVLKDVSIKAETIYPGVRIKIGNSNYNVKDELKKVEISKDHGEIVIKTY